MNYEKKLKELSEIVKSLAPNLQFHNWTHMQEVDNACKMYAQMEGLDEHNTYILRTAALTHDLYFEVGGIFNEEKTVDITNKILSTLNYTTEEIKKVRKLIMATRLPTNPQNISEKIICDADLDNLGRYDFFEKSELCRIEGGFEKKKWYEKQMPLFLNHVNYYTDSAKKLRGEKLKQNIEDLKVMKW